MKSRARVYFTQSKSSPDIPLPTGSSQNPADIVSRSWMVTFFKVSEGSEGNSSGVKYLTIGSLTSRRPSCQANPTARAVTLLLADHITCISSLSWPGAYSSNMTYPSLRTINECNSSQGFADSTSVNT